MPATLHFLTFFAGSDRVVGSSAALAPATTKAASAEATNSDLVVGVKFCSSPFVAV